MPRICLHIKWIDFYCPKLFVLIELWHLLINAPYLEGDSIKQNNAEENWMHLKLTFFKSIKWFTITSHQTLFKRDRRSQSPHLHVSPWIQHTLQGLNPNLFIFVLFASKSKFLNQAFLIFTTKPQFPLSYEFISIIIVFCPICSYKQSLPYQWIQLILIHEMKWHQTCIAIFNPQSVLKWNQSFPFTHKFTHSWWQVSGLATAARQSDRTKAAI